jgi:hypothetical protein
MVWMWYYNMVLRFEANPHTISKANLFERFFLWVEGIFYEKHKGYDTADRAVHEAEAGDSEQPLLDQEIALHDEAQ